MVFLLQVGKDWGIFPWKCARRWRRRVPPRTTRQVRYLVVASSVADHIHWMQRLYSNSGFGFRSRFIRIKYWIKIQWKFFLQIFKIKNCNIFIFSSPLSKKSRLESLPAISILSFVTSWSTGSSCAVLVTCHNLLLIIYGTQQAFLMLSLFWDALSNLFFVNSGSFTWVLCLAVREATMRKIRHIGSSYIRWLTS